MQISAWPSGWEIYYVVFLSALVALGIPCVLGFLSWLFSRRATPGPAARHEQGSDPFSAPAGEPAAPRESLGVTLGRRINSRFFLSAHLALVLIALSLVLIPYASVLHAGTGADRTLVVRGLISVLTVAACSALGLLYSARKGDLNWISASRGQEERP